MSRMFVRPAAVLALGAAVFAQPASAQNATGSAAAAPGQSAAQDLGEITVTAERRQENLQKVPISIGVINGANLRDLQQNGDDTLLSLSGRVPSL